MSPKLTDLFDPLINASDFQLTVVFKLSPAFYYSFPLSILCTMNTLSLFSFSSTYFLPLFSSFFIYFLHSPFTFSILSLFSPFIFSILSLFSQFSIYFLRSFFIYPFSIYFLHLFSLFSLYFLHSPLFYLFSLSHDYSIFQPKAYFPIPSLLERGGKSPITKGI